MKKPLDKSSRLWYVGLDESAKPATDSRSGRADRRLQRENERLGERLEAWRERRQQEIERLKRELELARWASKRQAAPSSKGEPKAEPKRPGRKAGSDYGRHGCRRIPAQVDETIMVPLPKACPGCGGACSHEDWGDQYQTEIVRQTRFQVGVGRCQHCQSRVQGRDDRQSSDALGAAASQLGPEAVSLATVLNKQLGLPFGKTAAVLEQGFGLNLPRNTQRLPAASILTFSLAARIKPITYSRPWKSASL